MELVPYAYTVDVPLGHDAAVERVTGILADEGFGILSTIDVAGALKKKLDAEMRPYTILGACNPPFAHRAITAEPAIGALLPCNVVVEEREDDRCRVHFLRPDIMFTLVARDDMETLATEVNERIERAARRLTSFMR
ncbi:MAG: DUF302 domain-containing protein [Deltaproteobacteria bacterium]|nr:DUF302 domain-containing protein [Deltaproteobacteria bacterium]MCB9787187.1 DUF302 domain-containing protein [Deltaproteobacteria bacterium]